MNTKQIAAAIFASNKVPNVDTDMHARAIAAGDYTLQELLSDAEFVESENTYQIRYRASDGRAVEAWWNESAVTDQVVKVEPIYATAYASPGFTLPHGSETKLIPI